jgi:hypothetical protein
MFTRSGGTVNLTGTLDNTSTTLAFTTTTGSWNLVGGTLLGGTVTEASGAELTFTNSSGTLNGVTFNNDLDLTNGAATVINGLTLNGSTANLGNASGSTSGGLFFNGTETLGGTGTVVLGGSGSNGLFNTGLANLTIGANILLHGNTGQISFGTSSFTNQGTISADTAAGTITLNGTNWSNSGTIQAMNGGTALAQGTVANFSAGTLTGGTWQVFANSTLRLISTGIVTNAATIVLDGLNSNFFRDNGTTDALAGFATNDVAGTFTIRNGRNFTTAGDFTNNGTLVVGAGSTFTVNGSLTNFSGGTLTGGTYLIGGTLRFNNAAIATNAATIVLDGAASAIVDQSSSDALAGFATNAAAGNFTIQNGRNFTTAGNFTNNGTLGVGAGDTLAVTGNYTQTSTATLAVQLAGTGAGQFGRVTTTGLATLDGTLNVTLVGGFTPVAGNTFQVLAFGSQSGDFATKTGFVLGSGLFLREHFHATELTLEVFQGQFVIQQQPSNTAAGQAITPAVQVAIVDPSTGNPIAFDNSDTVTVAIANNPGGGTLSGTLMVTVSNGIATFSDLSIDKAGSGYTLALSSPGIATVTSSGFAINPATADHLVFLQPPTDTAPGQTISPAVAVAVVDQFGNVVTSDNTDMVTLSLSTNPSGGTLGGTLTITVSGGVATFSNLSIDLAGSGYTLHATIGGSLADIDSNPFNIL